jgi:hypothetical protein
MPSHLYADLLLDAKAAMDSTRDSNPFLGRPQSGSQLKKIARQLDVVRDLVDECVPGPCARRRGVVLTHAVAHEQRLVPALPPGRSPSKFGPTVAYTEQCLKLQRALEELSALQDAAPLRVVDAEVGSARCAARARPGKHRSVY